MNKVKEDDKKYNHRRHSSNTSEPEDDDSVDNLMNTIMRKLTHVHIDNNEKLHQYDYCENESKIELLLPYNQRSVIQALMSDVVDYQINAMVKLRKYLSLEKISNNINNVLALGINERFVELLKSPSPILQYETCWVITNIAAGTTEQTRTIIDAGAIPVLIELLRSENKEVRTQAAWSLGNIAGDCGEFRDIVLHGGTLQPLLELWNGNDSIESKNHMLQVAMWTLANLCRWHRSDWDVLAPAFPILRQSIYFEDSAILSETCWALSRIFHGSHPKVTYLLDLELCQRLVELLKNDSISVVNPVLRTLTNIAYGDDQQTQLIINAGAIPILCELLSSSNASIRLETILVLANITAGTVAQIQSVIDAGCLNRLIEILSNTKESFKIRKEACWAISNATDVKHPQQIRTLINMGVVHLLIVFLTDCLYDITIQQKCVDALENILITSESELNSAFKNSMIPTSYSNWNYDPWKVIPSSKTSSNGSITFNDNSDSLLSKSINSLSLSSSNIKGNKSSHPPSTTSSFKERNRKSSTPYLSGFESRNFHKKNKTNQSTKWAHEMSAFNQLWKTIEILENSINKTNYYHAQDNRKVLNRLKQIMERWYESQSQNMVDTERQIDEVMMGVEKVRITESDN
ncbi:ARM repeat-containing protein [Piromyces finnis]|uniref:ARM repeat-containing protein n=2 Tax=Piromyces finnis TaxID=1754191 RepID=A0A1Y1V0H7_9FUNG|nr:ARM repeat-containing protein [Piromyces finnis]|eukprot:ORX44656.1 ARM repeat-containing protein [Piromyces finnis]